MKNNFVYYIGLVENNSIKPINFFIDENVIEITEYHNKFKNLDFLLEYWLDYIMLYGIDIIDSFHIIENNISKIEIFSENKSGKVTKLTDDFISFKLDHLCNKIEYYVLAKMENELTYDFINRFMFDLVQNDSI